MSALTQLERTATKILADLQKLELLDVRSTAKILRVNPKWVRAHLPIVVLSARRQRVRLSDIEAFQAKRTVWPSIRPDKRRVNRLNRQKAKLEAENYALKQHLRNGAKGVVSNA